MRKFWFSPNVVGNGILWLVGGALQIGGWVSPPTAYVLLSAAFVWTICSLIYWRRHRKNETQATILVEGISPDLLKKLKTTGTLENVSPQDTRLILLMSIGVDSRHGYNDLTGLFADRASGVPLNELKTRPCSQCGIPRNQRGKHRE